jgi:hypothetical protein
MRLASCKQQIVGSSFLIRYRKPPEYQMDLTKIELPNDILALKQQVQRLGKEY